MSAFEVSPSHIGCLINLGAQLGLRQIYLDESRIDFDLRESADRYQVALELITQNRTSVCYRYKLDEGDIVIPNLIYKPQRLDATGDIAQAFNWVACYRYQSCEDPLWRASFAYEYTSRLNAELIRLIVSRHNTTWEYCGPCLVDPSPGTNLSAGQSQLQVAT